MVDPAQPNFLLAWREYRGLSQERLADMIRSSKGHLSDLENGKKSITRPMSKRLALGLGITVEQLFSQNPQTGKREGPQVPLAGYVAAAGDEAHFFADSDTLEYVDAPRDLTPQTIAVQIRGDSLGRWYNGWLAYYDDVRDPPGEDLYNELCIVGLADGRVVLKILKFYRGGFILESQHGESITDADVTWAAKVKGLARR